MRGIRSRGVGCGAFCYAQISFLHGVLGSRAAPEFSQGKNKDRIFGLLIDAVQSVYIARGKLSDVIFEL